MSIKQVNFLTLTEYPFQLVTLHSLQKKPRKSPRTSMEDVLSNLRFSVEVEVWDISKRLVIKVELNW